MSIQPTPIVMKGYAIFNPATGLWSRGGMPFPKWSKNPKVWSNIGHVKSHLHGVVIDTYDFRNNRDKIVLKKTYRGCTLLDVTTMQSVFDIYDWARETAERMKVEDSWLSNREIIEE